MDFSFSSFQQPLKIVNFDNPRPIIFKEGKIYTAIPKELIINDKIIKEYEFFMDKDDFLFIMSDGVVHAGVGNLLNFLLKIKYFYYYDYKRFFIKNNKQLY